MKLARMPYRHMVRKLKKTEANLSDELQRVQTAIRALRGLGTYQGRSGFESNNTRSRRRMSAAARARISAAQKARWAKLREKKK